MIKSLITLGAASLVCSACIFSIDAGGEHNYLASKSSERLAEDQTLVTVERQVQYRSDGGEIADEIIAEGRAAGCSTVSVDSYRKLVDRDHSDDIYGARVVMACPEGTGPFGE